ncbi:MAG: PEP-CTERM sorting domain-containing protein [Candidatus Brocadiia bacterium]
MSNSRTSRWVVAAAALAVVLAAQPAMAMVIAYEWTEGGPGQGSLSPHVSFHSFIGPVLADDFTPAVSGGVVQVDWWGSAPLVAGAPDLWELTFHSDAGGVPAVTLPSGGISQHFVNAGGGGDPDGDGVFFYSTAWNPVDVILWSGQDYWFSVANALHGWKWANPGGAAPTVGTEQYDAVVSVGGAPSVIVGPHDGPWNALDAQDFAFRIWVEPAYIPEPATLSLVGAGLAVLVRRRRKR